MQKRLLGIFYTNLGNLPARILIGCGKHRQPKEEGDPSFFYEEAS